MDASATRRIVMLGKTGDGRSSLANIILGEELFKTSHIPKSEMSECQAETRSVKGRSVTLIDTPGFFETERPEEELNPEIMKCITECAPGPHAFLIVLRVEKFTDQEKAVINKIQQNFSQEVYKYATVLFTHGDQIPEGMEIGQWVDHNAGLKDLVEKCGGRCHVVDNKYWNNPQDEYRNNQVQVEALLNTIDEMIEANGGIYYTNEMLQAVDEEIQQEEEHIRQSAGDMSQVELREQAKHSVLDKLLIRLAGCATGVLLGALFGVVTMVGAVLTVFEKCSEPVELQQAAAKTAGVTLGLITAAAGAATGAGGAVSLCALGVGGVAAVAGAVKGGVAGYRVAEEANTPWEAAKRAAEAVTSDAQADLNKVHAEVKRLFKTKVKTKSQSKMTLEDRGENL